MDRLPDSGIKTECRCRREGQGDSRLLLILAFVLAVASVFGSEHPLWAWKEPNAWTLEDAEEILWNSPWAQEQRFRFFNSRRSIRQITYFVRLQSAQPVRLALAKAFLSQPESNVVTVEKTNPQKMRELAEQQRLPNELVLSLIMSPQFVHNRLNQSTFGTLSQVSYVQYRNRKIGLKAFVPPSKTTFGEAWFRFPRPDLGSNPGKLRFVTSLKMPYRIGVDVEFDASKLMFLGKLEY